MIAKLETGNGFYGELRYDVRADKGTAKNLVRVLDAAGVCYDYDEGGNLMIDPRTVAFDFRQQTMGYAGKGVIRKPVYHWVLSYSPTDKVPEMQMAKDAKDFLQGIGFGDTQYVMIAHYDTKHHHIHVVTNIVDNQGKRIPTMGLIEKAHEVSAAITKKNGYTWGEPAKKQTIDAAHKPHEKVRYILESLVQEAKAKANSIDDMPGLLKPYGVLCNVKHSSEGKPVGISFAYSMDGQLHTFRGSDLDRRLSAGYIVKDITARQQQKPADAIRQQAVQLSKSWQTLWPTWQQLQTTYRDAWYLYKDAKDAGYQLSSETKRLKNELQSCRNDVAKSSANRNDAAKSHDYAGYIAAMAGVVGLINPFAALIAILLSALADDIRREENERKSWQLQDRVRTLRDKLSELDDQRKQLAVSEKLKGYLDAKQAYKDFKESMWRAENAYNASVDDRNAHKLERQRKAEPVKPVKPASEVEPGVIHVTPSNYRNIKLPEGISVENHEGMLILQMSYGNFAMPKEGYYIVQGKKGYRHYNESQYKAVHPKALTAGQKKPGGPSL